MEKLSLHNIIPTELQIKELYSQLQRRLYQISHKSMPPFEMHERFVKNNPYRAWFIIEIDNEFIGNVYIQFDNSVGLNCEDKITSGQIQKILDIIGSKFQPLEAINSIRRDGFFLNVSSANLSLQRKLNSLSLMEIQRSYAIPKHMTKSKGKKFV